MAESCKSLAWRYKVAGQPFGLANHAAEGVDEEFVSKIQAIILEFKNLEIPPARGHQITSEMRALRSAPFDVRKNKYREGRLEDQRIWYEERANRNRRLADRYQIGLLLVEVIAFGTAIFSALWAWPISVYSVFSALAIAGVGWLQIKHHRALSVTYSKASHDLAAISSLIDSVSSENAWEQFVGQAEQAISKEHSVWLASLSKSPT